MERTCYVNAYNTFQALFELGVIAIVNENDTVAIDELKFGDNDTLSALVASLIEADWLFILTDVDRLYSADPRLFPEAEAIARVTPAQLAQLIHRCR
jgi:glutamate 5-kinase